MMCTLKLKTWRNLIIVFIKHRLVYCCESVEFGAPLRLLPVILLLPHEAIDPPGRLRPISLLVTTTFDIRTIA